MIIGVAALQVISYAQDCINTKHAFNITPNVDQPSDVAIGPDGYVYLVDGVNNRVVVVDRDGRWKFAFGKKGQGDGMFNHPMGVDISLDGKVFVADTGNHRIQAFDLKGNFLFMFPVTSSSGEKPSDPVDVLVSGLKDYVYISDNDNHKIRVYNQTGVVQFQWGNFGEGPGEFRYPGMLATNDTNEVFVVDVLNTRVQKFDPFGEFISEIGSWGVAPGKLFRPKGVALDTSNRVFVGDSYMGYIQVFSDLGRYLGIVCENNKPRQFTTPVGIIIDKNNERLHVVEMRANNISVLNVLR